MVSICVTCSVQGPPLSPLSEEHRQLLHVIVSPVVNMMELRAYPFHICMTCRLRMKEINKFKKMAQRGVEVFKSLLSELVTQHVQAPFFRTALEAKPEPITIKTDPENDLSTIKQQSTSVPASSDKNLTDDIEIKIEPESQTEADYDSNVSRNVKILDSISNPVPFKVRSGPVGSNGSGFTGPEYMIRKVPYVQPNQSVQKNPKLLSTRMKKTVTKGNRAKSMQVAKLKKNGEKLSSITMRNSMVLQQNISSNWHAAEYATKVDSNDGNVELFAHEGRKIPDILSQNSEQGVRKVCKKKKIRKKPEEVTCAYCGKVLLGKESIKAHIKRMHLGLQCHLSCETCGKPFRSVDGLRGHIRRKHKKPPEEVNPEWFCAECAMQFSTRDAYKNHLLSLKHTPKEQYTFVCEFCANRFPTRTRMQEHVNIVHLNKKKFKCAICEKMYGRKSKLHEHIRIAHENQARNRPHVCHLCGKNFSAVKSLKEHLNAHQGLRPYECELCPATFSYKAALFTHNKLKHLKIKTKEIEKQENNDADVGREKKIKRRVKKAADKVEGVENEEGIKGRKVKNEAGIDDVSGVEQSEEIQIELELIGHDAGNLNFDSYLNEMM